MNVNLEKIENGIVVTIGAKRVFCSTAESVCGLLAEWAMNECERLHEGRSTDDGLIAGAAQAKYTASMDEAMRLARAQLMRPLVSLDEPPLSKKTSLIEHVIRPFTIEK